jgi:hypothetical protein
MLQVAEEENDDDDDDDDEGISEVGDVEAGVCMDQVLSLQEDVEVRVCLVRVEVVLVQLWHQAALDMMILQAEEKAEVQILQKVRILPTSLLYRE